MILFIFIKIKLKEKYSVKIFLSNQRPRRLENTKNNSNPTETETNFQKTFNFKFDLIRFDTNFYFPEKMYPEHPCSNQIFNIQYTHSKPDSASVPNHVYNSN